jgi:sortase A
MRWLVCVVLIVTAAIVATSMHVSYGDQLAPPPAMGAMPASSQPILSGAMAWIPQDGASAAQGDPAPTTIVIPRLGIEAPVYERGVDAQGGLQIAPGYAITHFRFSAPLGALGNYVAYGHDDIAQYGQIFRNLARLQEGDPIEFRQDGKLYIYKVTGSHVVLPTDVSVLRQTTTATLTLITCTPYMVDTHRVVVTAMLAA